MGSDLLAEKRTGAAPEQSGMVHCPLSGRKSERTGKTIGRRQTECGRQYEGEEFRHIQMPLFEAGSLLFCLCAANEPKPADQERCVTNQVRLSGKALQRRSGIDTFRLAARLGNERRNAGQHRNGKTVQCVNAKRHIIFAGIGQLMYLLFANSYLARHISRCAEVFDTPGIRTVMIFPVR